MADNIIGQMFNYDPNAVARQRQQEAFAYAQLDPIAQANYNIYQGAGGLVDAGAGMMGWKQKGQALDEIRTQVMSNIDQNNPDELLKAAQLLNQAGDAKGAMSVYQDARNLRLEQAKIEQMTRASETTNHITPEGLPIYYDKAGDMQYVWQNGQKVPYSGRVYIKPDSGSGSGSKGENAFDIELAKQDVRTITKAREAYNANLSELDTYSKMKGLTAKDLFTGTYASGRAGVVNLFQTLGINTEKDGEKLGDTQVFGKISNTLVLDKVKALGFNPSNSDRDFVQRLIPNLEQSPKARQDLIKYLSQVATESAQEFERMNEYARSHKSLTGYKPLKSNFLGNKESFATVNNPSGGKPALSSFQK